MYLCNSCGNTSQAGEGANKVVTQTRPAKYENYIKRDKARPKVVESSGWEIVKEVILCTSCNLKGESNEN